MPQHLQTCADALEAFYSVVEFRLVRWLNAHADVFAFPKAKLGFIWAEKFLKSH